MLLEDCLSLLLTTLLLLFLMIQLTIITTDLKETVTQKRFFKILSSVLIDGKNFLRSTN